ncbi:MAG: histidinol dehydrogenase [Victivallales bacterium]|nr:histidinol dehydrogenase [Victivallales bacterium]
MKILSYRDKNFEAELEPLFSRMPYPPDIEEPVRQIIAEVKAHGDKAVAKFAKKFDNVSLKPPDFKVPEKEIVSSSKQISARNKRAIDSAVRNITRFARMQMPKDWSFSPRKGVVLGERFEPIERVGVYIPGGAAPLVSTVIHTAAIAKAAGVRQIVAATPPGPGGRVMPELLYAMGRAGVSEVYRLGGVYAIAALAFGTRSIAKVEKIVGPGNAYVTAAKRLVYGDVALDMVAGPSEIMIIADSSSNPLHLASDMLSQAEHGSGHEQSVLISTSLKLINEVADQIIVQSANLKQSKSLSKVIREGVFLIHVSSLEQAAAFAGRYAPEHLELVCKRPEAIARKVKAAGAIFIGPWTPESLGDFVAGPSHVLPTGGTARFFSGLTVSQFLRRMSVVKYTRGALLSEERNIACFADMEGLEAHGLSASVRSRGI